MYNDADDDDADYNEREHTNTLTHTRDKYMHVEPKCVASMSDIKVGPKVCDHPLDVGIIRCKPSFFQALGTSRWDRRSATTPLMPIDPSSSTFRHSAHVKKTLTLSILTYIQTYLHTDTNTMLTMLLALPCLTCFYYHRSASVHQLAVPAWLLHHDIVAGSPSSWQFQHGYYM